jgi:hypothetical protein
MACRVYLEFKGSYLTQISFKVGTCSIFFIVPVLWPRLITYNVMQSVIFMEDATCFVEKALYLFIERSFYWIC